MFLLCIRGAAMFSLMFATFAFWMWLFSPFLRTTARYGSPEYHQARADSFTMIIGGMALLIVLAFFAVLAWHYGRRWL